MMRGLFVLLALCLPLAIVQAETLEGRPTIIDGDSIVVGGKSNIKNNKKRKKPATPLH